MIDIILPSYNRAALLERAVQSVLNQTYQDFKLIIIDDGSTDETSIKMAPYFQNPKVQYLKQKNKGVSSARNLGIKNSSSEWIAFLDSDDEWLSSKLTKQMEFAADHPEYSFIHSNEIWMRNGARVNPKKKFDKSSEDIFRRSLETCLISPSTVMMKRTLCEEHGGFDENFIICEDYDLWLKILSHTEVGFMSENLIKKYGGHGDQLSTKFPAMDYWRIKSMHKLFMSGKLDDEKKNFIILEINKKAPILLNGYQKHENLDEFNEISELLKSLPGR